MLKFWRLDSETKLTYWGKRGKRSVRSVYKKLTYRIKNNNNNKKRS